MTPTQTRLPYGLFVLATVTLFTLVSVAPFVGFALAVIVFGGYIVGKILED